MVARQPFSWTSSQAMPAHSRSVSAFSLPYHSLVMPLSNVRSSACDNAGGGADEPVDDAQQAPPSVDDLCLPDLAVYDDIYGDFSSSPEVELPTPSHHQPLTPPFMLQSSHSPSSSFGAVEDLIPSSTPEPPLLYLTEEYKALAECFAQWIADYLWKAIEGPQTFGPSPASNLATGIRDVLWSTMLQPSAIFLALWYLSRLPAEFLPSRGAVEGTAFKFRNALFCSDVLTMENACHRLFVCICMLADRELHDNCFSSATWSEISRVPSGNLAELEYCSLSMLEHSLWISPKAYSDWLSALSRYHSRLPPGQFKVLSGRDCHATISRQFDHIIDNMATLTAEPVPKPVFIRPGEHIIAQEMATVESESDSDIDLDFDGPLREEYVPRRVSSRHSSFASRRSLDQHFPPSAAASDDAASYHSRRSSLLDFDINAPSSHNGCTASPAPSALAHKSWTSMDCGQSSNHAHSSNPFSSATLSRWASTRADHTSTFVRPQWLRA